MLAIFLALAAPTYAKVIGAVKPLPLANDSTASTADTTANVYSTFIDYMSRFGRGYHHGTREFGERKKVFERRLSFITAQNSNPQRLWTAGVNTLTDRTEEELSQLRGWRPTGDTRHRSQSGVSLLAESAVTSKSLLETIDWRNLSMASNVLDQGSCGACWAVATAVMLQGRYESFGRGQREFSVQQLVDCVPNPNSCGGTGGCSGATVEVAMHYVERVGLAGTDYAPYLARGGTCKEPLLDSSPPGSSFLGYRQRRSRGALELNLAGWHQLPQNEAMPLMAAVSEGPVAVSVAASTWLFYHSGIFDLCAKDSVVDHAVVLFGYGQGIQGNERDVKYWIVRNSWGNTWGEKGFIRLQRMATPKEDQSYCGTDHDPKAGLACKPYPESVRVCGMCGILYDSVAARF